MFGWTNLQLSLSRVNGNYPAGTFCQNEFRHDDFHTKGRCVTKNACITCSHLQFGDMFVLTVNGETCAGWWWCASIGEDWQVNQHCGWPDSKDNTTWRELYLQHFYPANNIYNRLLEESTEEEDLFMAPLKKYQREFKDRYKAERNWLMGKCQKSSCMGSYEQAHVTVLDPHPDKNRKSVLVAGDNGVVGSKFGSPVNSLKASSFGIVWR